MGDVGSEVSGVKKEGRKGRVQVCSGEGLTLAKRID